VLSQLSYTPTEEVILILKHFPIFCPIEHLRVSLPQHLSHPLVRYSSSTQPCSISGPKVVNAEVRDLRPPKRLGPNRFERGLVSAGISDRSGTETDSPSRLPFGAERLHEPMGSRELRRYRSESSSLGSRRPRLRGLLGPFSSELIPYRLAIQSP
jgi:hypothetical protein